MYAVIVSGGKQYRVSPGSEIVVDRVADETGAAIVLDRVLLVGGEEVAVGTPTVPGATVNATVLSHDLGAKTEAVRYLHRRRTRTQNNGRARLSVLRIDAINT